MKRTLILSFTTAAMVLAMPSVAAGGDYPGASVVPLSQKGWELTAGEVEAGAPADEPKGGKTRAGTPVERRGLGCFPTEARNLFSEVDQVWSAKERVLRPMNYTENGKISAHARDAIRGQNTWMLWGEGNEAFWDWLSQHGYGIADFLVFIDSRQRDKRFQHSGVINQPGMKKREEPILGLFIDQADGAATAMKQPQGDIDDRTGRLAERPRPATNCPSAAFKVGDQQLYEQAVRQLAYDGPDPLVYGYASGVVGLRLFANPDFFGEGDGPKRAREYWQQRVMSQPAGAYYDTEKKIHADPKLVRPFRVSMTCAFCHIGPHPLNAPKNPAEPQWSNLSSTIGGQYWTPTAAFTSLRQPGSFIWQFIASQQPGTIDTSLVSTDHINNANTINAVFDIPARLERAKNNRPERQSAIAMTLPGVEDAPTLANPRHTPRVLVDGADSVGAFGALARVYLNIGAYSEQWANLHNPVIGFKPQRPFEVGTARANSVFWQVAEAYRIPQLKDFFTYRNAVSGQTVTAAMKLAYVKEETEGLARDAALASRGREVFLRNCAMCHSSKQPDGFDLSFSREWAKAAAPKDGEPARFVLPMDFAEWEAFKRGAAYGEYLKRLFAEKVSPATAAEDPFLKDNFLSTDTRVPVTLVGTNAGRAIATNGMRGQVWDNFSSEDYKALPAVGPVRFYNPYAKDKAVDDWGNNDAFDPPAGGPGYYRPASLISLWATAPYLHNNALGIFNRDPSVKGRLAAFDDGIDRLLFRAARKSRPTGLPGDLRQEMRLEDPGFIYRTTQPSYFDFPAPFIRPLLAGIVGGKTLNVVTRDVWIVLAVLALVLAFFGRQRHVGFVLASAALLIGALLRVTAIDSIYPAAWLLPAALLALAVVCWLARQVRVVAPVFFVLLALGFAYTGYTLSAFVNGERGPLVAGPIPKGTPVNLVMNMNPEAPLGVLLDAGSGLVRGLLRVNKDYPKADSEEALRAFEAEAGAGLMRASKSPDFVLDRGHWFAESLSEEDKRVLKAFLRTL